MISLLDKYQIRIKTDHVHGNFRQNTDFGQFRNDHGILKALIKGRGKK